eukprot:5909465-Heterocapsa_arctica.AAC.1
MSITRAAYFSHRAGGYSADLADASLPLIDWWPLVHAHRPDSVVRCSTAPAHRAGFHSGGP